MDTLKKVENYISEHGLVQLGDTVLLAVSGGVDSMCMMDIMAQLAPKLRFCLAVASFDHQLRPESADDVGFVGEAAKALGLSFFCGSADIASLAQGNNIQNIARKERYSFLRSVAHKINASTIATAHQREDQSETLILHLLRGSGAAGLAAMSPRENGIIRPLLCLSRCDVEDYMVENSLKHREDSSNASTKYFRNRIRIELMPLLVTFNPQIHTALNTTTNICREEDRLLEDLAENALAELLSDDYHSIDGIGFEKLPLALKRRVLKKAFCLLTGDDTELSFAQVESVIKLKEEQSSSLPVGLKAYRRRDIFFAGEQPPLPEFNEIIPFVKDGKWHKLAQWGWEYMAEPMGKYSDIDNDSELVVPMQMSEELCWRTRKLGDSVTSTGKGGSRKLKNIFINHKIPIYQRPGWPILEYAGEIIWAPKLWQKKIPPFKKDNILLIKVRQCAII